MATMATMTPKQLERFRRKKGELFFFCTQCSRGHFTTDQPLWFEGEAAPSIPAE